MSCYPASIISCPTLHLQTLHQSVFRPNSLQTTCVRLQFAALSEHDKHNSCCPPNLLLWQEIKVPSRCSGWCQPSVCIYIHRCEAQMTDNLYSHSSFTQVSAGKRFFFRLPAEILMIELFASTCELMRTGVYGNSIFTLANVWCATHNVKTTNWWCGSAWRSRINLWGIQRMTCLAGSGRGFVSGGCWISNHLW